MARIEQIRVYEQHTLQEFSTVAKSLSGVALFEAAIAMRLR